jgi:hypothetical protein
MIFPLNIKLILLGLDAKLDLELGVISVMPPTLAFSRNAIAAIIAAPESREIEDVYWRRLLARRHDLVGWSALTGTLCTTFTAAIFRAELCLSPDPNAGNSLLVGPGQGHTLPGGHSRFKRPRRAVP